MSLNYLSPNKWFEANQPLEVKWDGKDYVCLGSLKIFGNPEYGDELVTALNKPSHEVTAEEDAAPTKGIIKRIEFNKVSPLTLLPHVLGFSAGYALLSSLSCAGVWFLTHSHTLTLVCASTVTLLTIPCLMVYLWLTWRVFSEVKNASLFLGYILIGFMIGAFSFLIPIAFLCAKPVRICKEKLAALKSLKNPLQDAFMADFGLHGRLRGA